jgi:hypothetical protein
LLTEWADANWRVRVLALLHPPPFHRTPPHRTSPRHRTSPHRTSPLPTDDTWHDTWQVELVASPPTATASLVRTVRLARIRDALLRAALRPHGRFRAELLLMADLDFRTEWTLGGLVSAVSAMRAATAGGGGGGGSGGDSGGSGGESGVVVDGVCSYGTMKAADGVDLLYDTLAFRDATVTEQRLSNSGAGRFAIKAHAGRRMLRTLLYGRARALWPMFRVRSCFGGLAVYNASRLRGRTAGCGYEAAHETIDCEHANLHACLSTERPTSFHLYVHPQLHMPAPIITQPGAAPLTDHEELPSALPPSLLPEPVRAVAVRFYGFIAEQTLQPGSLHDPPQTLLLGVEMLRAALLTGTSGGTVGNGAWGRDKAAAKKAKRLIAPALDALGATCDAAAVRGTRLSACAAPTPRNSKQRRTGLLEFEPTSEQLRTAEAKVMAPPDADGA